MHEWVGQFLAWFIPFIHCLGILNGLHAVMNVRAPRGVIAWVLALITLPYIAIPAYWIFGRYKFAGYIEARRSGDLKIHHLVQDVLTRLAPFRTYPEHAADRAESLGERLAGLPFTTGNRAKLLVDGDATFSAIFEAVDAAENYILVQFFIVHADCVGNELKERLIRKARAGVRIYFLFDALGSNRLPKSYVRSLRREGVQVHAFNSSKGWASRFQINFRNHRKIVVVDGKVAFIGGLNVGDEYLGRHKRLGPWRDTHVAISGPAVQAVQIPFMEDWHWATGELPELHWDPEAESDPTHRVLVLPTGPSDRFETCHLFFVRAINMAQHRLWITSPYFVPDPAVVSALQLAALRGVDVRIMLPQKPDHLLVYLSAFSYFDEMLEVGAKLYRYQSGFMHQKVLLIDDYISAIGTANLDNRSFYLNFELILLAVGKAFAVRVEEMLEHDFQRCAEISQDDYAQRSNGFKLAVRLARLASPLQ